MSPDCFKPGVHRRRPVKTGRRAPPDKARRVGRNAPGPAKFARTVGNSSLSSRFSTRRSSFSAVSSSTATVFWGRHTRPALRGSPNLASSAFCTSARLSAAHTTSWPSSSDVTSSAPASMAASIMASASAFLASNAITPTRSNMNDTEPVSPRLPPDLVKKERTSEAVRLRLSVSASTITATPPGP